MKVKLLILALLAPKSLTAPQTTLEPCTLKGFNGLDCRIVEREHRKRKLKVEYIKKYRKELVGNL